MLCACSRLTRAEFCTLLQDTIRSDPGLPVTPGRIFRKSGRRVECGLCCARIHRAITEELVRIGLPTQPLVEADFAEEAGSPVKQCCQSRS